MSHPIPTREYGENEYESDSPHKDVEPNKRKAVKKAMKHKVTNYFKKAVSNLKK